MLPILDALLNVLAADVCLGRERFGVAMVV